jgi:hypothetical protein
LGFAFCVLSQLSKHVANSEFGPYHSKPKTQNPKLETLEFLKSLRAFS